ncbi:MAG: hypothetical protein HY098_03050 [Nitrospinae bacterium]|nr:hypothetical protein [Nitrospinota bacterium]
MQSAREKMAEIIKKQPDDATYEEILRELAFERMIQNGLKDSRSGKTMSNDEMRRRIATWRK